MIATLRFGQWHAENARTAGIDAPGPDHLGRVVRRNADRRRAQVHLDGAVLPGQIDAKAGPRGAGARPQLKSRGGDAGVPARALAVVWIRRDRAIGRAQRVLPATSMLV